MTHALPLFQDIPLTGKFNLDDERICALLEDHYLSYRGDKLRAMTLAHLAVYPLKLYTQHQSLEFEDRFYRNETHHHYTITVPYSGDMALLLAYPDGDFPKVFATFNSSQLTFEANSTSKEAAFKEVEAQIAAVSHVASLQTSPIERFNKMVEDLVDAILCRPQGEDN